MNETSIIRPFETGDLARLHEIREAAFKPVFESFRRLIGETIAQVALVNVEREQADHLNQICEAGSSYDIFVVDDGQGVVAFCAVNYDHGARLGEIDLNAVHPEHQGKGIGTLMYGFALDRMREAGMRAATVGTGGDVSHARARRAYEKAGFGPAIPSLYLYRSL